MKGIIMIYLMIMLTACVSKDKEPLFNSYETLDQVNNRIGNPTYQIDNRYVWDKRYSNVGESSMLNNPIYFAGANTAYIQNKFCHITVITDQDDKILLKETEGGMCNNIYGNIFEKKRDKANININDSGLFAVTASVLIGVLGIFAEAAASVDYSAINMIVMPNI